jgi:hypothetical protein
MAMSVATLEILEQAQFSPVQARALARVLEVEAAAHRSDLATKGDIAELRTDIAKLEARLEVKIESAKGDNMRFTILTMLGQSTLLAGVMYFLLENAR